MADEKSIIAPFRFHTRLHLSEITGTRSFSLPELATHLKVVPGASIYHHTHRFLQQHQYHSPEPPNDFAYWVSTVIGEKELGERLASIDTMQFGTIAELRESLLLTITAYLVEKPSAASRTAGKNEAFSFIKSISVILPTGYEAHDLAEFAAILDKVTVDSLYYHIFEARLRLGRGENDFSYWLRTSLGNKKAADAIARLDPYTYTLEELRRVMGGIVGKSRGG